MVLHCLSSCSWICLCICCCVVINTAKDFLRDKFLQSVNKYYKKRVRMESSACACDQESSACACNELYCVMCVTAI